MQLRRLGKTQENKAFFRVMCRQGLIAGGIVFAMLGQGLAQASASTGAEDIYRQRELFRLRQERVDREQILRSPGSSVYVIPHQPTVPTTGCRALQPAYDRHGRLLGQICQP